MVIVEERRLGGFQVDSEVEPEGLAQDWMWGLRASGVRVFGLEVASLDLLRRAGFRSLSVSISLTARPTGS